MRSALKSDLAAPPAVEDGYLQKLAVDISAYGLSAHQARLYLYLLGNKPLQARDLSKALGMHRVDVYRKLRELEDLGVIEVFLDSPKRFAALDPKTTISSLIRKAQSKVLTLERSGSDLEQRLESHAKSARLQRLDANDLLQNSSGYYKFVKGTQQYFAEIRKLIQNTKREILKISSANGLKRAMMMGLHKDYEMARKRGVEIKLISEITPNNLTYANKFAKLVELRHVNDVHFRFTISDRSVALLSAKYDDRVISPVSGPDSYFLFSDLAFASASCFLFEHLWHDADTFEERLEKLGKTQSLTRTERVRVQGLTRRYRV